MVAAEQPFRDTVAAVVVVVVVGYIVAAYSAVRGNLADVVAWVAALAAALVVAIQRKTDAYAISLVIIYKNAEN